MSYHREQDYEDSYSRCDECPGGDRCGLCFNVVYPNHWTVRIWEVEQRKDRVDGMDGN